MKRLLSCLLATLVSGCAPLSQLIADRGVRERVGVLSHLDITWESSTRPLARALAYYRSAGAETVIILGDPTRNGSARQRAVFEAAWKKAFAGAPEPKLVLADDPYAFCGLSFTGVGRLSLTDLLCVHPRNGRMVNAGSMHGIAVSKLFEPQPPHAATAMAASAQGLFVLVRDEGLEIRRLDFSTDDVEEVGAPWRVDREGLIDSEADAVPRFWADTHVDVTPGYDAKGRPMYTVRWPPVLSCHTGARAFSYDVQVGEKVIRRVQSAAFHRAETKDGAAIRCAILASELGEASPRFGITPVSSLGRRGETVWSP